MTTAWRMHRPHRCNKDAADKREYHARRQEERAEPIRPAPMPNAWRIKELAELALAFRYQSSLPG